MKRTPLSNSLAVAAALTFVALACSPANAQSTAFTYQGLLDDAGAPTSGLHDFRFRLFDAASGGVQIGSTLCVDNVNVAAGVFTAQLDFGQQFATTAQRYLEIGVRLDTGLTCANATGLVVLSPRQQLTATPMATHANSAFALDAADGSPTNAVFVDGEGRVGIGTTSPEGPLHVTGSIIWGGGASDHAYSGQDASGMFIEQKGSVSANSKIRLQTSKSGDATNYSQLFIDPNTGFAFTTLGTGNGNVGVGTTAPAAKLDVRGDIRLGPNGELRATGGEENLRIVRGIVDFSNQCSGPAVIIEGSGFSVAQEGCGRVRVTFTTPFADAPAVTGSGQDEGGCGSWVMASQINSSSVLMGVQCTTGASNWRFNFIAIGPR